jgi:prepilin-type N-terminal cleavage/methylation domain-containing protein
MTRTGRATLSLAVSEETSFVNRPAAEDTEGSLRDVAARRERGYSLVEILLVVAVAVILVSMCMPMYFDYMRKADAQAAAREAEAILDLARMQAIKQNCDVTATRSTGGFTFSRSGCSATAGTFKVPGMTASGIYPMATRSTLSGPASVTFTRLGAAKVARTFTVRSARYGTTMRILVNKAGRTTIKQ